ncbi:MAG: N-acetylmuramoyl-L-alanine amidase [Acidobacteriota bacterium]
MPGVADSAEAAALYTRLVQEYPSTPQASLASNRLADARRRQPGRESPATPKTAAPPTASEATAPDGDAEVAAQQAKPGKINGDAARIQQPALEVAKLEKIRHFNDNTHTRIVLDFDRQVVYETGQAKSPARFFIDLTGVEIAKELPHASKAGGEYVLPIDGDVIKKIRVARNRPGVVRIVFDMIADSRYSLFTLDRDDEPFRIVIDVPTRKVASRLDDGHRPKNEQGDKIPVARQLQLGVRRIVIDPGHGGEDPGAIGRSGITEKELTLALAKRLASEFRQGGFEVLLTREEDRTVPLQERTAFANQSQADLFISLHINAARNRKLRGFETYYLNLATDPTAAETAARENASGEAALGNLENTLERIVKDEYRQESSDLAKSIQDSLVMTVAQNYQTVRDLGVKSAPFYVLVGAEMPSVLVETSFLSNAEEEQRLRDSQYRQNVVRAVHDGILSYIERRRTASQQ